MADLKSLRADSAAVLAGVVDAFQANAPREALAAWYRDLMQHFLVVASASLLVDGEPQKFFLNLCRCAENGRRILLLVRRRALDPLPSSWNTAHVAALVAADFARAAEIAVMSRATWAVTDEHEDEFVWARVLHGLGATGCSPAVVAPLLDRLSEIAPDATARVAAGRALAAHDAQAFAAAFVAGHADYEADALKKAASFATPVTAFAPHRFLWLDGLALLRIAEREGILPSDEFACCPWLARVPMTATYAGDWAVTIEE